MPKKILCEGIAESLTSGIIYIYLETMNLDIPLKSNDKIWHFSWTYYLLETSFNLKMKESNVNKLYQGLNNY